MLPKRFEGELLIVKWRVGHDLVMPAVMNDEPADGIFEDGGIAGRIGQGDPPTRPPSCAWCGAA
jgi:hypothetical protein